MAAYLKRSALRSVALTSRQVTARMGGAKMTKQAKIEALHRRLVDERRKVVETAADSDTLPPARYLGYLADLDGAIVAVEAVLEDRTGLRTFADMIDGQKADAAFA